MAQRPHVPKFGNWESEENVPYTAYFDKARKGKTGGKLVNPNDPQENPSAFPEEAPPVRAPPLRTASDPEGPLPQPAVVEKAKNEQQISKDENEFRRSSEYPARHDTVPRRAFVDSPHHRTTDRQGEPQSHRKGRTSGGSERNFDQSPLHPHYQARAASKGGISSPSWENKNSTDNAQGFAPSTPNRRLRNADAQPERGSAVPKFGDWDESNPASADGYTHIFNRVREEKQLGTAKVPAIGTESPYSTGPRHPKSQDSGSLWSRCFPCLGK